MQRMFKTAALMAALVLAPLAPAIGGEAGDAVFAERGPWQLGDARVEWELSVEGPAAEGFRPVAEGRVTLAEVTDPSDGQPVLEMTREDGTHSRRIGPFPVSGGDPVLTFFLEQTARDMATMTGGNPHYIRNRMKDALFRAGSLTREDGSARAEFRPFAEDPNAARMGGFESLTLTFVMADPTQPIREMRAETGPGGPGYRSSLVLQ